jgi:hypothetical protein
MCRRSPISAFDQPPAASASTSRSRADRDSSSLGEEYAPGSVVLADQGDGFGAVRGLAQYLHVGRRADHDHEAAAYQCLVVGDNHADRHRAPSLACTSLVRESAVGRLAVTRKPPACGPADS